MAGAVDNVHTYKKTVRFWYMVPSVEPPHLVQSGEDEHVLLHIAHLDHPNSILISHFAVFPTMKQIDKSKEKRLTAQRHDGKPLRQPPYIFQHVPFCNKDFQGSCIQEISDREIFTDAIAEMLLLCKEVMRRKNNQISVVQGGPRNTVRTSKPLSLEYIADRIDVDEPLFGFLVRSATPGPSCGVNITPNFEEGMLQGFVTMTTFTTWQKTFQWNSLHESAFSLDEPDLASQMANGKRIYDKDGSLSTALESTVRCGDVWNEGVIWPHIAEISLLGGLGCGQALLSLAIERLERMPASASRNYDYVVLHATANAIEFYEAMGFVRVGAITHPVIEDTHDTDSDKPISETEMVSCPLITYYTKKHDETPTDIAKTFGVNVWDVIFLNHSAYPSIGPKSFLRKKTKLFIPKQAERKEGCSDDRAQWYIAKEDETPKCISTKFKVSCQELIDANRTRLPDLCPCSRLMKGTRIQVSHFHIRHEIFVPFCHWSFPDEPSDQMTPSYMMVRKLNRSTVKSSQKGPVESSFSVSVTNVFVNKKSPTLDERQEPVVIKKSGKKRKFEGVLHSPPKKPLTSFFLFMQDEKKHIQADSFNGMTEFSKNAADKWKKLPPSVRSKYDAEYERQKSQYESSLSKFRARSMLFEIDKKIDKGCSKPCTSVERRDSRTKVNLFNKIVKLKKEGSHYAHSEFEYYYVLTFIPDLFWCHLAPLRTVGFFGPNKPTAEGRPIWMLVNEEEGKEVDISAQYCEVVRARAMKGGIDADKEQWDIYDRTSSSHPDLIGNNNWTKTEEQLDGPLKEKTCMNVTTSTDDLCDNHNTGGTRLTTKSNLAGVSAILARRAAMKALLS